MQIFDTAPRRIPNIIYTALESVMRITVAPTPIENTDSGLQPCSLVLRQNIPFLKVVANYKYSGGFKAGTKCYKTSGFTKIKQIVHLLLSNCLST